MDVGNLRRRRPAPHDLWRVAVTVPAAAVAKVEEALDDDAAALLSFESRPGGPWRVEALVKGKPDRPRFAARVAVAAAVAGVAPPRLLVRRVPDVDWVTRVQSLLDPVDAGRYYVHGARQRPGGPGRISLRIEAGAAFGTGDHATTRGCLVVLDRLAFGRSFRNALDMGCGSGILAIAVAKTWPARVLAVDNDPLAVDMARTNARENGVSGRVRVVWGDGYHTPAVHRAAPFDLVVANILALPLAEMAPALARHLAPGGIAMLSGFIEGETPIVLSAHRPRGLKPLDRLVLGGWVTLVLQAPRRPRRDVCP